jgi:aspartate/methionine/tyrosine aminotransferase
VTNDHYFASFLIDEVGVAGVPGSSFYSTDEGNSQMRFCFCKKHETLETAGRKLARLTELLQSPLGAFSAGR